MSGSPAKRRTILFAHPSPDLYGSDRMLLESVAALVDRGWDAVVTLPADGPLAAHLVHAGARVLHCPTPVLRKSLLSPRGLPRLAAATVAGAVRGAQMLRAVDPAVVYVNTVTVPLWPVLGRLAGAGVLVHVHEAEQGLPRPLRVALAAPLLAASVVVVNSRATAEVVAGSIDRLRSRLRLVYNGVAGPDPDGVTPPATTAPDPLRIVFVGRLSPRKGVEVAVRAVAALRGRGRTATLDLVGAVFPGYEWFDQHLHELVRSLDLDGAVRFPGFASPVWPAYAAADVAVVPSLATEPFGNVSVEAQLAQRPVVVARTQGLVETVRDGVTGVVVEAGDPAALAAALDRLAADWPAATALARAGRADALDRFAPDRYRAAVADLVDGLAAHSRRSGRRGRRSTAAAATTVGGHRR